MTTLTSPPLAQHSGAERGGLRRVTTMPVRSIVLHDTPRGTVARFSDALVAALQLEAERTGDGVAVTACALYLQRTEDEEQRALVERCVIDAIEAAIDEISPEGA